MATIGSGSTGTGGLPGKGAPHPGFNTGKYGFFACIIRIGICLLMNCLVRRMCSQVVTFQHICYYVVVYHVYRILLLFIFLSPCCYRWQRLSRRVGSGVQLRSRYQQKLHLRYYQRQYLCVIFITFGVLDYWACENIFLRATLIIFVLAFSYRHF